jgi:uncharacterized protein (TIGR00297 family)
MIRIVACLLLGGLIYWKKILDGPGTVIATLMGIVIVLAAGFRWLALLLLFLLLGFLSTLYRYTEKKRMNVAEKNGGRRQVSNVLANGLVPTAFSVAWYLAAAGDPLLRPLTAGLTAAYIASIATVTGDTLSSEIGVLSRRHPILITTFRKVPPGTEGGISFLGTAAGISGAVTIGLAAGAMALAPPSVALLSAVVGGTVGFHVDSLLGAVFERRGWLGNSGVNFFSTIAGALVGAQLALA